MKNGFLLLLLSPLLTQGQPGPSQHVNPFIGTGGHGHTFPGAVVPFGMVQLSPDTRIDGSWDGCSGYHYSDEYIYGFSHTHLSGTGCSDYGDIALLPIVDKSFDKYQNGKTPPPGIDDWKGKREKFSHANEVASAGFYSVALNNKVKVDLTTTTRCGFHQYTWPANVSRILIIKIDHRDKTLSSSVSIKNNKSISGLRTSEAWARNQHIYYTMDFSEEFEVLASETNVVTNGTEKTEHTPYVVLRFKKTKSPQKLLVKVGVSNVGTDGARKNLEAEIPHWDFEKTKAEAKAAWNKELGKIEVTSADKNKLAVFYTALYHCMIHPSVASDVDGQYRGRDNQIHKAEGFTYYTVFSLWDTFRGLHPLLSIIDQKRTSDFIQTFLAQYQQAKILPVWELSSNETWCMIGYHSVSVMADAYAKGIRGFDAELAFEAMQTSSSFPHFGLPQYMQKGFLQMEDEHEAVSKTLEYAYDDWCISSMAKRLGKTDESNVYLKRAKSWTNLFDAQSGFIRPRTNGGWLTPFEPREVNNNFTEANAWQYTFFVPHDVGSMMKLMGGEEKFAAKLDALFSADTKTEGRDQADITGLIGQYAHGNEPSHHMAYLYVYAKQPWKTQEYIHKIQHEFYKNSPDGLIGNEDCGQMSAWHVLSALGFYQVCPGRTDYAIGSPLFEKAVIHLENGKTFTVQAKNVSDKNYYIQDAKQYYLTHEQIMRGGEQQFTMADQPAAISSGIIFPSSEEASNELPAPVFVAGGKTFRDSMRVEIQSMQTIPGYELYYSYDDPFCQIDTCLFRRHRYTGPFYLKSSADLWTFTYNERTGHFSRFSHAYFHLVPHNWSVQINSTYSPQYSAGGDGGVIDGLRADENWKKGGWQGYQGQDFECVVDLQQATRFSSIQTTFLQDQRAWIFMPVKVEYAYSLDGKNWTPCATVTNTVEPEDEKIQVKDFTGKLDKVSIARYIKVKAYNYGKLPEWHQGYGMGDAFIFVDEITVK